MTTQAVAFNRDALREWLAAQEWTVTAFAEAIGNSRTNVHRWLNGSREPDLPVALVLSGLALGARGGSLTPAKLRTWMRRGGYDTVTLADALGMHRASISRWLGDARPQRAIPFWLPIALAYLAERPVVAAAS